VGTTEDIGDVLVFVASYASHYITGIDLIVDVGTAIFDWKLQAGVVPENNLRLSTVFSQASSYGKLLV